MGARRRFDVLGRVLGLSEAEIADLEHRDIISSQTVRGDGKADDVAGDGTERARRPASASS